MAEEAEQCSSRVIKGSRPDRKETESRRITKENKSQSKDSRRISSGGIAFLYAQGAQERDREPSDHTRKSRQLLDREKLHRW
jgi:hypothetical protein